MNYQDTDKCCLCGAQETTEHIIRCNHPTRLHWRWKAIHKMQKHMKKHNVEDSITDAFCSCVTDWLDTGTVNASKYNSRYHRAIHSQTTIGWRQLFMGKLSQEWLHLQPHYKDKKGNNRPAYIWGASLVEASLQSYIALWEQRNKDAHSPEAHIHLAKERAAKATRKLFRLRHHARFRDSSLFPDDVETFIETSTAEALQRYVVMNSKAIHKSVKRASTAATQHTRSIVNWFRPVRTPPAESTPHRHSQDNLVHDAYSKKKRRKSQRVSEDRTLQPRLTGYLSLRQAL